MRNKTPSTIQTEELLQYNTQVKQLQARDHNFAVSCNAIHQPQATYLNIQAILIFYLPPLVNEIRK